MLKTTKETVGKKSNLLSRMVGKTVGFIKKIGKSLLHPLDTVEKTQEAKDISSMSDESKLNAHIANQSYNDIGKREQHLGGYELDKSFNSKKHAVYHNNQLGKTIISYRGTVPTDLEDLYDDAHILRGTQASTDRYKRSEKLYDDVKSKYKSQITSVGHSLGGNISEHIAKVKGGRAETYNTGRGIDKGYFKDSLKCKAKNMMGIKTKHCNNVKRHHIVGDAISANNKGIGEGFSYKSAGLLKSHSLSNFIGKSNPVSRWQDKTF